MEMRRKTVPESPMHQAPGRHQRPHHLRLPYHQHRRSRIMMLNVNSNRPRSSRRGRQLAVHWHRHVRRRKGKIMKRCARNVTGFADTVPVGAEARVVTGPYGMFIRMRNARQRNDPVFRAWHEFERLSAESFSETAISVTRQLAKLKRTDFPLQRRLDG